MEAATLDFQKGMRYISAACRCFEWSGDEPTRGRLHRHGEAYRQRGQALMMGMADGALWDNAVRPATPGVQGSFRAAEW